MPTTLAVKAAQVLKIIETAPFNPNAVRPEVWEGVLALLDKAAYSKPVTPEEVEMIRAVLLLEASLSPDRGFLLARSILCEGEGK